MASWWDSIKEEFNSNTIKNPLDSLFPNARTPEQKKVVPSPIKEKVSTTFDSTKTNISKAIDETKTKIGEVTKSITSGLSVATLVIIGVGIAYLFSKKK